MSHSLRRVHGRELHGLCEGATLAAMARKFLVTLGIFSLALAGCEKAPEKQAAEAEPRTTTNEPVRSVDACALLPAAAVQEIQGEAIAETKPTAPAEGQAFTVSQCFYTLPTHTNSIVLTVTQRGQGPAGRQPQEYWEKTFGPGEKEGERERGEEGEEKRPPLKVEGVGEEAFWAGNAVGGALYVLKGDVILRVSTGGKDQLERCKRLAQVALAKL